MIEKLEPKHDVDFDSKGNSLVSLSVRYPNNKEIIDKINEIIDHLNRTGYKSDEEILDVLTRNKVD